MFKKNPNLKSAKRVEGLREKVIDTYEGMTQEDLVRETAINQRLILDRLEVSLTEHRRIRNNLVFFAWVLVIVLIVEIVGAVI